ncbi:DUF6113 family protein [Isoptericola variabilis]|uniref:Uncharacterized protein n=1 Tax=Isoptericola variabilis (strain 225) TaxID=743718 RepID=F6FPS9_ISOV2|nr:DUF6113 family protein [Isoptericola variabilis]AEG43718.1 hypothetical protein Isova_0934 [Isoptericola variabilis 225]TWH27398.1 hypothetical protein L600_000500000710 [Isoptericola variabilis J7]
MTPSGPPTHAAPSRGRAVVVHVLLAVGLGVVAGVLGTVTHRTTWLDLPVGIVLAFALTASTGVVCRAWSGLGALLGCGAGWLLAVQVLAVSGPGGDVLVPAQPIGLWWTYGGLVVLAVVAFLPRSWFSDRPVRRRVL